MSIIGEVKGLIFFCPEILDQVNEQLKYTKVGQETVDRAVFILSEKSSLGLLCVCFWY